MFWADNYIKKLNEGETVEFRPRGHSMTGKVNDGDLVEVSPCLLENLKEDDIVLCSVKGKQYLHLIKAIKNIDGKISFPYWKQ